MLSGDETLMSDGMGVVLPSTMFGRLMVWFGASVNRSDWPKMDMPLRTQVARARTGPKLAGTFGSIQLPSGPEEMVRFSTLTTQLLSSSCVLGTTMICPSGWL